MKVKQVRVIQNTVVMGGLCALIVWLVREGLTANAGAVAWGLAGGVVYGLFYWHRLVRRISRKRSRFERNKVFVKFISPIEVLLLAASSSHYILIAILVALLLGLLFDWISGHWWSLLIASFGLSASVLITAMLVLYERKHGPVYYQYDSRAWTGTEGMLYQVGEVLEPLAPAGRVMINGEIWNAVSLGGEHIGKGERVEVISRDGLTLKVDRVAVDGGGPSGRNAG